MDGQKGAGSVFMCRLCNLFSPSRPLLLAHCSQLHPQQEPPDDIIIALQPLVAEPAGTLAESPVKRKRGRPKGSTKKRTDWTEGKADSTHSLEDKVRREEERNKEEADRQGVGSGQRTNKRSRMLSEDRSRISKEGGLATGNKKSVVSVVLKEDETIPGVSKMVPVEDSSAETECVSIQAKPQSQLKIFACEFCNKIFKFRHSLISHLRTHTQEKPFKCPHCDYASAIKGKPRLTGTQEKLFCSPHCDFIVHIERVHLKVKQHCSFCQKKYSDVKNLLKHMEKRHNLKDPVVSQNYQQLRLKTRQGLRQLLYHCPTCNRRFKNQLERERHLLVHGPQRPFACLLCDHAATKLAALAAHVRKHPFLYVCSVCDGKFVSSQRLKSHLKESHLELDQEQAFTDCINNSFYLMQPGGSMWGDEEREDTERGINEKDGVVHENERREEGVTNGVGGEELRDGEGEQLQGARGEDEEAKSQDESAEEQQVIEGKTREVSEVFHQSAFQQVFSSLQKTLLDMETFQRLRKIYGDLECQYCGKLFWYKVHYNAHVRTHTKEHLHYCSKCSYSSITKSSLKRHLIQKHSGLLLPCSNPGCKYSTPDKYKLQAHQRTHQEQAKSVTCPVCHHSYPEHRLKHHIKTVHPDTVPVQGKGLMVKRAEKCPYCDSYFLKNSSDFQQHIWAHQGKRFQCTKCDFTCVSKPSLLRHMEQHAEFKPFRCAHCHYSCNIAGPLKRHYNRKHPDQKYQNAGPGLADLDALKQQGGMKCPECEFIYGTNWELNRHLKSKHGLKLVEGTWEVGEAVEAQYLPVEDEEQLTEAHVAALQDN
eukprot:superscaffoldBa00001698_g11676